MSEPAKKSALVLGNSKSFTLPMYGLMAGAFGLLLVAALALWAPDDRFQSAVTALTQIVSLMIGLAGAGGVGLAARDAMTKGITSSKSDVALAAITAQNGNGKPPVEAAPNVAEPPPGMEPG